MIRPILISIVTLAIGLTVFQPGSRAQTAEAEAEESNGSPFFEESPPPPRLRDLKRLRPIKSYDQKDSDNLLFDVREDAIREAALSYGARGGLAARTYEIRQELEKRDTYLDRVYNFRSLLIVGPDGFYIEPPIVSESMNAFIVENGGQEAAVSDTILNINKNANIVSTSRNWREYMERDWGEVDTPPDILLPQNFLEREIWEEYVAIGWKEGIEQADEIFQQDLNRLGADFNGMIRYKKLVAYNMISEPYALFVNRGVTGGNDEMRIGDRAIKITGPSELKPNTKTWQPVSR